MQFLTSSKHVLFSVILDMPFLAALRYESRNVSLLNQFATLSLTPLELH